MNDEAHETFDHNMAIQCPYCFGRGFKPEYGARSNGGFYARECQSCHGTGQIESDAPNYRRAIAKAGGRP